jgi:hypothetical protein
LPRDVIQADLKSIQFLSYQQQPPSSHGVVIRINNVNGTDSQNVQCSISVHGTDATWVAGTFASVKNFFGARRTRRQWLHACTTGQTLLLLVAFPLEGPRSAVRIRRVSAAKDSRVRAWSGPPGEDRMALR